MAKETTTAAVSRQRIELSLTKPPVHSFNRQLVRIVLDTVGALAATLWLLRENELILCEEIEETVGAVKGIRAPQEQQQRALRAAFEKGEVVVLSDTAPGFDPLGPDPETRPSLVFIPVAGLRGSLGVLRLILPPTDQTSLSRQVQLAETLSGYYSLYSAQRILTVQHEERRDIDRLSKAILQLQHYTFSRELPDVVVNSAVEVARIDRTVLLTTDDDAQLKVRAVSSVAQVDKKSAWTRLACELGEVVLQLGQPVQFIHGISKTEDIEDEELREYVNSYVLLTEAKSLLIYPLVSGQDKVGVLLLESFSQESALTVFERVLCTVYATHAASALDNHRRFESVPLSRFYAKRLDREDDTVRRGKPWLGRVVRWTVGVALLVFVVWFAGFHPVPEKVTATCFVMPETERTITAKSPGQIESVLFAMGDDVAEGTVLIKLRTDQLELQLHQEMENAENIRARIVKLRGKTVDERDPESSANLAEVEALTHALAAKEQEIALLRSKLEDCYLRAPISGTVLGPDEPEKMLGYVVRAGEPLCRIGSIGQRVKVRLAVPDDRVSEVQKGQEAEIRLRPLITEEVMRARIETVDERSSTYKNSNVFMANVFVKNSLAESPEGQPQYRLKPGMTGKAKVILPGEKSYVSIYGRLLYRKLTYWLY